MEVVNSNVVSKVFDDICDYSCFKLVEKLYMKFPYFIFENCEVTHGVNSFCFNTDTFEYIYADDYVVPVNAKIVVE